MASQRAAVSRILTLRPLRPPSLRRTVPTPRLFTHNTSLYLIAQRSSVPRPQLPYLTQLAPKRPTPFNGPSQQLARLLSTETRDYVKEQTYLVIKWTILTSTFLFLAFTAYVGVGMEMEERQNPTPTEWTFWTRHILRGARHYSDPARLESAGFIDWAKVGIRLRNALRRLEDPTCDGKGLAEPAGDGEEIVIEGIGRAGFDISAKSWPWRAGYFEVIMGCAEAAEHLDSMVMDKEKGFVFQKEFVQGPSNPDPRPVPRYMGDYVPKEENVVPASPPPETYYMRVLTGKGFTTKQKMQAARAYANWLDFKGLPESAEEMYRWSLDIAKSALPLGMNPDDIMDSNTAILKESEATKQITPNVLRASTDLAVHFASTGNVASALPILLSVLRARRSASVSPFPAPQPSPRASSNGVLDTVYTLFTPTRFPDPPPSGDDPLIRSSDKPTCEESALMLYVGEILFASKPSQESLGWTRQAVTIADANLAQPPVTSESEDGNDKQKCAECLGTGLANWETMLGRLASQQNVVSEKKGWFSWSAGTKTDPRAELEKDQAKIEELKDRVAREKINFQTPVWSR